MSYLRSFYFQGSHAYEVRLSEESYYTLMGLLGRAPGTPALRVYRGGSGHGKGATDSTLQRWQ